MSEAEQIAASLTREVKRAILICPFNSRGSGFRGGTLARWNEGNQHMGGVALFRRESRPNYSGDYYLTPLGLEVRSVLERDLSA